MKLKNLLAAQDITGVTFAKQNVEQPLEQEVEEPIPEGEGIDEHLSAHATVVPTAGKRKMPAATGKSKKKKIDAKEAAERDLSNFIPIGQEVSTRSQPKPSSTTTRPPSTATQPPSMATQPPATTTQPPHVEQRAEESESEPRIEVFELDSEGTPPPSNALHLGDVRKLATVGRLAHATQYRFLQQVMPAELHQEFAQLSDDQARHGLVHHLCSFLGFAVDNIARTSTQETILRGAREMLSAETAKVSELDAKAKSLGEELQVAKDALKKAEATCADLSKRVGAQARVEQDLRGAVDLAKKEAEIAKKGAEEARVELQKQIEANNDTIKERDECRKDADEAIDDLKSLCTGLPMLAQKIMDSKPVSERFDELLEAAMAHERSKCYDIVAANLTLPDPLPEAVAALKIEGSEARLSAAQAAVVTIEIPRLKELAEDPSVSIDEILTEGY